MKLQTKIAKRILERKTSKISRKTGIHNFETAQTVAVLWSFDEKDAFQILHEELMAHDNISMQSLYYNEDKNEIPDESDDKLFVKQLNWLGFPQKGAAISFLQKKYDILIDLTVKKKFPIEILVQLSLAAFKVGYNAETNNPYDLNIDIHQNPEPDFLAKQIIYYLNLINKGNNNDNTFI